MPAITSCKEESQKMLTAAIGKTCHLSPALAQFLNELLPISHCAVLNNCGRVIGSFCLQ